MSLIRLQVATAKLQNGQSCQILEIFIDRPDGILEPQDLNTLVLPKEICWQKGVIISGRGPIWLYGYLIHQCHPAVWVACYDPRLGAVVVATHVRDVAVGTVLKILQG